MKLIFSTVAASLSLSIAASIQAPAQEVYKIGVSAGLTGYAAAVDRAWRDGLEVAADDVNSKGGVMGRKIKLIVEDNKSEPQEAVTGYRKMISSDKVDIFVSGCVSAGNFAAAQFVVRAEMPMVLCSILPPQPAQVKWAFSFLAPPRFEVEKRYAYLKDSTQIRKVGVLHDPSPYANLQKDIAVKSAAEFGIEVPVVEQYKQDDADLSPQISKINANGAKAIIKIGLGGSTLRPQKISNNSASIRYCSAASTISQCSNRRPKHLAGNSCLLLRQRRSMRRSQMARSKKRFVAFFHYGEPSTVTAIRSGPAKAGTPSW